MEAYVKKYDDYSFMLMSGRPENHANNELIEIFSTRRQAIRYAEKGGYDLIVRNGTLPYKGGAAISLQKQARSYER